MGTAFHRTSSGPSLIVVLLLGLLTFALAEPGDNRWSIVRGNGVEIVSTPLHRYAVRPYTELVGDVLLPGAENMQPSLLACAQACDMTRNCSAFNWCGNKGGCLSDPSGSSDAANACTLRKVQLTGSSGAVLQLAAGDNNLATAGVRVWVPDPGPLAGYEEFPARHFFSEYDLTEGCPQPSRKPGGCFIHASLQEARAWCDAWPECQGFTFSPLGLPNDYTPYAMFKGSGDGKPLDLCRSSLAPIGIVYVKEGQVQVGPEDGDGGLSPAAIAGIALGAASAAAIVVVGAVLTVRLRRRRRRRRGQGCAGKAGSIDDSEAALQEDPELDMSKEGMIDDSAAGELHRSDGKVVVEVQLGTPKLGGDPPTLSQAGGTPDSAPSLGRQPSQGSGVLLGAAGLGAVAPSPGESTPALGAEHSSSGGSGSGNSGSRHFSPRSWVGAGGRGLEGMDAERSSGGSSTEGMACLDKSGSWGAVVGKHMLAEATEEEWNEVVLPREAVELSKDAAGRVVKLGVGASGEVFHAVLNGATPCACKQVKLDNESTSTKRFIQESRLLWKLQHPHIVRFIGVCLADDLGMILMELMPGLDLGAKLNSQLPGGKGRVFAWENRGHQVALQIALGLAYLHKHRIVHLDLKSRNVLLTSGGTAKLGDVGFSRFMHRDCISLDSRIGTWDYCAPEVLLGQFASEKADIFSLGVLLWEICTGEEPRRGTLRSLQVPQECPPRVAELHQRCLNTDPEQRPSAEEVVAVLQSAEARPRRQHSGGACAGAEDFAAATAAAAAAERLSVGDAAAGEAPAAAAATPAAALQRRAQNVIRSVVLVPSMMRSPMLAGTRLEGAGAAPTSFLCSIGRNDGWQGSVTSGMWLQGHATKSRRYASGG